MLVHLRLTLPTELTDPTVALLLDHDWVTNVVRQDGVSLAPAGDLVEADVAREKVNDILADLDRLGVCEQGGVVITRPTGTPFAGAKRIEAAAPGDPEDAVIWESVLANAETGARPTVSYQVFLALALLLAAIAVIEDSSILVIGAMVVGPEFTAIGAACAGIVLGRWSLVGRSLRLLMLGFVVAVAAVCLLALVGRLAGVVTEDMVTRPRPQTGFIWHPDLWSFVVALVAGSAGALALAVERTSTMVGVFISVTTVPAAGNLALAMAFWEGSEMLGSLEQLGLNIVGMVVAGSLTLLFQRLWWTRAMLVFERLFGQRPRAGVR